jgi:CheY-like chemotaxis protein
LVVEDDAATRDLLVSLLTAEGYAVTTAADGAAALERVAQQPPDLILLELRLPGMDGQTFAARYQQQPGPHAPIVVLSAHQERPSVDAIPAAGRLGKPFDLDDLLEAVDRCTRPRPAAPRVWSKQSREEAQRRRQLQRLGREVGDLRAALARVQADARRLLEIELARPLHDQEVQEMRTLRRASERLRWELQHLYREFELLQTRKRPPR